MNKSERTYLKKLVRKYGITGIINNLILILLDRIDELKKTKGTLDLHKEKHIEAYKTCITILEKTRDRLYKILLRLTYL